MPAAFPSNILRYTTRPWSERPQKFIIVFCMNIIRSIGSLGKKLGYSLILIILSLTSSRLAWSFNFFDLFEIGSAYLTHLTIHEMGHQIVADEVGATNHKITFFTEKKGDFYLGLSTYDSIPSESRLPYAMGGERMNSISYEYHLAAYRRNPTTFNKTMLFFDTTSFLGYTLLANYVNPDNKGYDPTLIRTEIGMSKELMLSFVLTKTALNTWRIFHPEMRWTPVLESDFESVKFKLVYCF
jgi:hypothetical protein